MCIGLKMNLSVSNFIKVNRAVSVLSSAKLFHLDLAKRFFSLSYNVVGGSPNSKDTPLLMAHGLMGSKNNFKSIAKKLNDETGRTIITYDARNHGNSAHYDSMSLKEMCGDALQLLDELSIEKCVFIGHSMGGRVAMYTALANPDRIESLIVIDSSPSALNRAGGSSLYYTKVMEDVVWDRNDSLSVARKHADSQLPSDINDMAIRNFLLTNVAEVRPGQYGWRLNLQAIREHVKEIANVDLTLNMSPYINSTLFVAGGKSDFLTSNDYPVIRKFFPNCQITHIPDCGHWVHSEKPEEFLDKVLAFLQPQTTPLF